MAKSKSIFLKIATPCQVPLDDMETKSQGQFCTHCQEIVIDFTSKSPSEIYEFISKHKEYRCGTFYNYQLNRDYYQPTKESRIAIRAYAFALAMGCLSVGQNTRAETFSPVPAQKVLLGSKMPLLVAGKKVFAKDLIIISGKVIRKKDGVALTGVNIVLLSNGNEIGSAYTESDGSYSLQIQKGTFTGKNLVIKYSRYPYATVRRHIKDLKFNKIINIKLYNKIFSPKSNPVNWDRTTGRFL